MSITSDTRLLFQTDQQIKADANHKRKARAAEKVGHPIKVSSKIIDFEIWGQEAWTAESGWQARRVDLASGKTEQLFKGHQGPVTSLALYQSTFPDGSSWLALFTGSWDKTIRVWDANSGMLKFTLEGHSDFVKSLTVILHPRHLLLSTSSDRTCRIWDLSRLSTHEAPVCSQILKDHTRPVECAAWRVETEDDQNMLTLAWTGDSLGKIKEWSINEEGVHFRRELPGHATSVAQMAVTEGGLWTASMDNTAIFHPFNDEPRLELPHPRYVKSILPVHGQPSGPLLLTGSEDEDIRLWDEYGALLSVIQGHTGEVTRMRTWVRQTPGQPADLVIVSAGLDGTLRRWSIDELRNPSRLIYEPEPIKDVSSGMTEAEERELEEMMA